MKRVNSVSLLPATRTLSTDPRHNNLYSRVNGNEVQIGRLMKVVIEWLLALLGVIVLLPLMTVIAAAVKLDGGPVLYRHLRIGKDGRQFYCLKFRSMRVDGDIVLTRFLQETPEAIAEWVASCKLTADPRVTGVGRFLRVTSLDELPQLINIIRLEMSLVGPRPIVAAELPRYGSDVSYYLSIRPGLTGLWQVSGRTGLSYEQRVSLDSFYVKNWSLLNDLRIILVTVPAVIMRRGAC